MIQGGNGAQTSPPRDCQFRALRRAACRKIPKRDWAARIPGRDRTGIGKRVMKRSATRPGIEVTPRWDVPALPPKQDGPAEALIRRLDGPERTSVVSYGKPKQGQFQRGYCRHRSAVPGNNRPAPINPTNILIRTRNSNRGQASLASLLDTCRSLSMPVKNRLSRTARPPIRKKNKKKIITAGGCDLVAREPGKILLRSAPHLRRWCRAAARIRRGRGVPGIGALRRRSGESGGDSRHQARASAAQRRHGRAPMSETKTARPRAPRPRERIQRLRP